MVVQGRARMLEMRERIGVRTCFEGRDDNLYSNPDKDEGIRGNAWIASRATGKG